MRGPGPELSWEPTSVDNYLRSRKSVDNCTHIAWEYMVKVWKIQYSSGMAPVTTIPPAALEWLTGTERASVLLVGASGGYAAMLARAGHSVTVVDRDVDALTAITRLSGVIHVVAARGESLPFDPRLFSSVLAIQNFHTFAPGLALGEWARVLRPHGRVGLAYLTRDDSVPWVKKLRRIVQSTLPDAMTSDYGVDSVDRLNGSAYFLHTETVSFRLWVPSTRAQLQDSARHATGAEGLDPADMESMLDQIGALYDEYARVPDPLMLPYKIQCWRAEVDQSMLGPTLIRGDEGLSISL